MNDPKAIINAYMDDELTEDQHRELVAWIRQAPGNIDRFITECYLHSQLQDIFGEEQVARDVMALQAGANWFAAEEEKPTEDVREGQLGQLPAGSRFPAPGPSSTWSRAP